MADFNAGLQQELSTGQWDYQRCGWHKCDNIHKSVRLTGEGDAVDELRPTAYRHKSYVVAKRITFSLADECVNSPPNRRSWPTEKQSPICELINGHMQFRHQKTSVLCIRPDKPPTPSNARNSPRIISCHCRSMTTLC